MSEEIRIMMYEVVGSPLCVASSDGQKVFERIHTALNANRKVLLSFHNVTALTSAFLNAAIGQLYGRFDENHIRSLLKVEDAEQDDLALLKRVVDNAKLYFKNTNKLNKAIQETINNEI